MADRKSFGLPSFAPVVRPSGMPPPFAPVGNASYQMAPHVKNVLHQPGLILNAWAIEELEKLRMKLMGNDGKPLVPIPFGKEDHFASPHELAFVHPGVNNQINSISRGNGNTVRPGVNFFTHFNMMPDNIAHPIFVGAVEEGGYRPEITTGSTICARGIRDISNATDGDVYPGDMLYWDYPRYQTKMRDGKTVEPVAKQEDGLSQTAARVRLVRMPWKNGTSAYPEQLRHYFMGTLKQSSAQDFDCLANGMNWLHTVLPSHNGQDHSEGGFARAIRLVQGISKDARWASGPDDVKKLSTTLAEALVDFIAPAANFPNQQGHWQKTTRDIVRMRVAESSLAASLSSSSASSSDTRFESLLSAVVQVMLVLNSQFGTQHYEAMHMRFVCMSLSHARKGYPMQALL
jgi:hypothetical protein